MSGKDGAAFYHYILTGNAATTTVGILTALDADTIVTGVEATVDNQGILARLQVKGITVLCIAGVAHQHLVNDDVLAHQRMEVPCGRVLEDDTFQHHVLTLYQRNHHRTQETLDSVPLRSSLGVRHVHVGTLLALGITLRRDPVAGLHLYAAGNSQQTLPVLGGNLLLLHGAPVLAVTVDNALAGDGNVLSTLGTERRLQTTGVQTLERGLDDRIQRLIGSKEDDGASLQVQLDVALEHDGTGMPHTLRHHQLTTALLAEGIDGLGKGLRVQRDTVAHATKVGELDLTVGNGRSLHLRHLER